MLTYGHHRHSYMLVGKPVWIQCFSLSINYEGPRCRAHHHVHTNYHYLLEDLGIRKRVTRLRRIECTSTTELISVEPVASTITGNDIAIATTLLQNRGTRQIEITVTSSRATIVLVATTSVICTGDWSDRHWQVVSIH